MCLFIACNKVVPQQASSNHFKDCRIEYYVHASMCACMLK